MDEEIIEFPEWGCEHCANNGWLKPDGCCPVCDASAAMATRSFGIQYDEAE